MKVIIVTGFINAGKTSVMRQLAQRAAFLNPNIPTPLVFIENEIGQIGLEDIELPEPSSLETVYLTSGCACCSLASELVTCVCDLESRLDPSYAVIEPASNADIVAVKSSLESQTDYPVRVVSVLDGPRWLKIRNKEVSPIVESQLKCADVLLINKCEAMSKEERAVIEHDMEKLEIAASIFPISAQDGIDFDILDVVLG